MNTTKIPLQESKKRKYWEMLAGSKLAQSKSSADSDLKRYWEKKQAEDQEQADRLINYFFNALSPPPEHFLSNGRDIEIMSKALQSIYEIMQEGILSGQETDALIEFLVSKFVKRRFGIILNRALNVKKEYKHTFKTVIGKLHEVK